MGMTGLRFSWKIWKEWHESTVFLKEWTFFFTKYGHVNNVFFKIIEVFLTKYGHENSNFFVKNWEKKGILLTLLAHNIVSFWQNWRFFDQIWAWQQGVFHDKIEKKNYMWVLCFWENRRFLDKILAWELFVFSRMDVFEKK